MRAIRSSLLLVLLLVSVSLAAIVEQTPKATAQPPFCQSHTDPWCDRARVAWRYFQPGVGWNSATGLSYDSANWRYFTLWGLASYMLALVAAYEVLPSSDWGSYSFGYRVNKIMDFIDPSVNPSFRSSSGVPWLVFSAEYGTPVTSGGTTNVWDYGRLLISLYILHNYLSTNLGDSARAARLYSLVTSQNSVQGVRDLVQRVGPNLYGYYVAQGFRLWPGFDDPYLLSTETSFYNRIQNGPFVDPSLMYGVSGIPSGIGNIVSEIQLNAIMELNGIKLVTESSTHAWPAFYGLAGRIMQAQWNRWMTINRLTAWSEGALAYDPGDRAPGFVYQNIVDRRGMTWVITDPSINSNILWTQTGGPTSYGGYDNVHLPIVFTKVGLGFQALYGNNTFTQALVGALWNNYAIGGPFKEGLWEQWFPGCTLKGCVDGALNVQTNEAVLTAAAYKLLKYFDITVTPQAGSSWTVLTGKQANFTVSASLNPTYLGHTLTLNLTGYPGTYNFNPPTLSESTLTSTLTIQAGSTPAVYPVSISAVDEYGYTSVVGATLNIVEPDFSISADPQSLLIRRSSSATSTISIKFLYGFSAQVDLSASPDPPLTANLNPTTFTSNGSSTLTVFTTSATQSGNYHVIVTGSGGGKTHSVSVLVTVPFTISASDQVVTSAANTVYFIFPDWDSRHAKPPGVGYASVTDWTALGYVYGMMENMPQITALDTNSTYIDQTTGAPKLSGKKIVLFGGPLVNALVHYYEGQGIALVRWALVGSWSTGTEYYYDRQGNPVASMSITEIGGGHRDMMLVEIFNDLKGNTVMIFSGFGWKGTFAAGLFFKSYIYPSRSQYDHAWYLFEWDDSNSDGFVTVNEIQVPDYSHGD